MRPFHTITGRAAVLEQADVDTDQIIPARHLKRLERDGFGAFAFEHWRGREGFWLSHAGPPDATFLVAGPNFGCGSSREHAPWALQDLGLRAILAPSFADIFRTNCERIGLLPITLEPSAWDELVSSLRHGEAPELEVDLPAQRVRYAGAAWPFEIDPHVKDSFSRGLDFVETTLTRAHAIDAFESRRPAHAATTLPQR